MCVIVFVPVVAAAAAEQAGKSLIDIFPLDNEYNDEKCMSPPHY
jgi:hypothetical protein